jgi:hypothetical protein
MTDYELHGGQLAVLPLRLETVTITGGNVTQQAALEQINFNNQIGGNCLKASCDQVNVGINAASITQNAPQATSVTDVIEDSRRLAQIFILGSH